MQYFKFKNLADERYVQWESFVILRVFAYKTYGLLGSSC